jgi:anti-sigma regulatory factor (Ser/Thr protein kinase)
MHLSPAPASAGEARRFVRDTLRSWGRESLADIVSLLTSELVTNAVLHARTPIVLALEGRRSALRVEVRDDAGNETPVRRQASVDATYGRGLALVDAMASDWGVRDIPDHGGKAVWFEVRALG